MRIDYQTRSYLILMLSLCLAWGSSTMAQGWRSSLYPDHWTPPENASFYNDQLIQDFSYAGYRRGEEPIPNITGPIFDAVATYGADPTGASDSTVAIQNAIDAAASAGGGVVYLPTGNYLISPQGSNNYCLVISGSNIVLRGAGAANTFLTNTETNMRSKQVIRVSTSVSIGSGVSLTADLTNPTRRLPVASPGSFAVGDYVLLKWNFTDEWIAEHGQQSYWSEAGGKPADAQYTREVVAVNEAEGWIEVDAPTRYTMKVRDSARVEKITGMLSGVGIESLAIGNVQHPGTTWGEGDYSDPTKPAYEVHASYILLMENACDSWITGVESYQPAGNTSTCHILSNGILVTRSFRVTVSDCSMSRPQYGGGGGNGYMYRLQYASECLVKNSVADFSRHGIVVSHPGTSGNVFLDCEDRETGRATGHTGSYTTSGSGSDNHMHFSHSNLWDSCHAYNSFYTASHRGTSGTTPHALTSAQAVYWNTSGSGTRYNTIVESEQARYGYVIGTSGTKSGASNPTGGNTAPADILEGIGMGDTLEPQSLYADQLTKRQQGLLIFMEEDAIVEVTSDFPLLPSVYNYESGEPSYAWSQVSGPATTFDDPSSLATTVDLPSVGTYVFELTADNGTNSVSEQIILDVVAEVVEPVASPATRVGIDEILGEAQENAGTPGYYAGNNYATVGATGSDATKTRKDSNVIYRYALPTLPAGEVITGFTFTYQITALRDHSNDDYQLDTYLLDSADPTVTGTALYYQGPADANHALVGSHFEASGTDTGSITLSPAVDVTFTVESGDALTLLQSFYNGSTPTRSQTALRFNLDQDFSGLTGDALNRYILNNTAAVSELVIFTMPGTFNDWVAGQGLGTEDGPGDDPDGDGVTNSLEAWLGTDPATPSNSFSAPSTDLTTTSFTHPRNMRAPTDLSASYEWSPNLVDWYPDAGGPIDGPTVSFSSSTLDGTATVTATASEEMPRLFLRVVVTQN
jgi:hypothetical protein